MKNTKIISWNVNGLRAWMKKPEVWEFLEKENPDIFCIQENKCQKGQAEDAAQKEGIDFFTNYKYHFGNFAEKKGYSGTGIFSKIKPISEIYGLSTLKKEQSDKEGRVITLEFEKYFLVTVYTPNSKAELLRVDYRYNIWDKAFLAHMKKLEKKKPVVVCGDLNVAHSEIDLANPKTNRTTEKRIGNAGFSDKERERFSDFMSAGFIDTFRFLHPETVKYSWWSYRAGARDRNIGWRIDYFLISESLKGNLEKAEIHNEAMGSDHCPVSIKLKN